MTSIYDIKIGDAVYNNAYNPNVYYGLGIVERITLRGPLGSPARVKVHWSKGRTKGDIHVQFLRPAHKQKD